MNADEHYHVYGLNCWLCGRLTLCACGECLICGPPPPWVEIEREIAELEKERARRRAARVSKARKVVK